MSGFDAMVLAEIRAEVSGAVWPRGRSSDSGDASRSELFRTRNLPVQSCVTADLAACGFGDAASSGAFSLLLLS
ncbi:hypothetical protein NWI01_00720 [Nitrobacter winogradskyi]|uniref:Uncharacterized protein n=1 Tax=Nitrobacter winogradskyi TaxID=913 RepID=A0A4Y3W857_NITWI|nr:hypothetical protein NWI01_00720 [Nitrobacter winogradskyi]